MSRFFLPLMTLVAMGAGPARAQPRPPQKLEDPRRATRSPPEATVIARGIESKVDLKASDAALRFSFPIRVPAWFLWQQATDCAAYVRGIREVKKCEHVTQGGKPAVYLEAEIFGRRYGVVVGIRREFRRGRGKVEFETRDTLPTPAKGALRVDTIGDGQSRLAFEATMPRDPEVPDLVWRIAVAAAVHQSAAKIQSDLESEYAASKRRAADTAPDLSLTHHVAPRAAPAPPPPPLHPTLPAPPAQKVP
jgi:hypothetical protein